MGNVDIEKLKFDEHNFNLHTLDGMQKLEKSVTEYGYGRSILLDKDDNIIGGNGVVETAKKMGLQKVRVVETEGDELIAVKRKDLSINSKEGRSLALADNAVAAANLNWNKEELESARTEWNISPEDWGVRLKESETEKLSGLEYKSLYYEPKEKPFVKLEDCVNLEKFNAKLKAIDEYKLTKKQKDALKLFAYRFIKIDFEMVANYYAFNASEEEKKAIERLRLVLIDGGAEQFIEDDMLRITEGVIDMGKEAGDD